MIQEVKFLHNVTLKFSRTIGPLFSAFFLRNSFIVFFLLIDGKMDGQGRYQASTLELNFVNDVELMLQQIQKALEMSDKVVSKLERWVRY